MDGIPDPESARNRISACLETGQHVAALKALSYSDSESEAFDFSTDSFVLTLADSGPVLFTSATDWTLRVERGAWPALPSWAWPPDSWRYEDVATPIGSPGFEVIRGVSDLMDEVGEIVGAEISFDGGTLRFKSGDSVVFELDKR